MFILKIKYNFTVLIFFFKLDWTLLLPVHAEIAYLNCVLKHGKFGQVAILCLITPMNLLLKRKIEFDWKKKKRIYRLFRLFPVPTYSEIIGSSDGDVM